CSTRAARSATTRAGPRSRACTSSGCRGRRGARRPGSTAWVPTHGSSPTTSRATSACTSSGCRGRRGARRPGSTAWVPTHGSSPTTSRTTSVPGRPRSSDASGRAPTRGPAGSSHQTFPAGDGRTYRANREEVDVDVRVRLLGGFEVVVDGVPVPADVWRRRGAAGLVKLLALAPRQRLHREQVIEALWPGEDPVTAGPRLHKAAHFARRGLGRADAVVLDGEVVHLFPDADVVVDATAFEARAVEALARGDPAEAALVAADVTGPLLPDDPYEVWADDVRERLRTLHLD